MVAVCLYFTKSEPIFKTNTNLTRGARGSLKLIRTLGERGNSNKESGTLCVLYLVRLRADERQQLIRATLASLHSASRPPKPFPFQFFVRLLPRPLHRKRKKGKEMVLSVGFATEIPKWLIKQVLSLRDTISPFLHSFANCGATPVVA